MKILITGATGFIGHHLAHYFVDMGYEVYGTYRTILRNVVPGCKYICVDLAKEDLKDNDYDCIIHCAGQVSNARTWDYVTNSIITTKRLISYCERINLKKIIFLSSIAVYGEVTGRVDENTKGTNLNCYAQCKVICERLLEESKIHQKYIIRLSRVVGEGGFEIGGFLASFAEKMIKNEEIVYTRPNILCNNLFHVQDLARLCKMLIFERDEEKLCIGTGALHPIFMRELVQLLHNEIESNSRLIEKEADQPLTCHHIDITRMIELGYCPMNTEDTLKLFAKDAIKRFGRLE